MPSNLDLFDQPTRFVGRELELGETRKLLEKPACRLLTLVGVGGIGKTRLAVQLARQLEPLFPDGAWLVNLQPLQSGAQIVPLVVDAIGLVPSGHGSLESQLLQYLQNKKTLLLFDNFEHVLDGVRILTRILQHAPEVQLLVTSREALSLPGEWLYPLEGLSTPQSYQTDQAEFSTAVELFIERARQLSPDFSWIDNRAGVVRICQLVEGNPLAIEMAASWTKTLRCAEIAAEIQQNLNFLSSNLRHVPERHRSMRAVFAQTWMRLSESEQDLFKRLTVFRSGFRREAAESIAGATLPLLSALMDKCLLRREAGGRYQMHELLRQYAHNELDEAEIEALTEMHARYYCDFLAQRKLGMVERWQVETNIAVEEELENIRTAWQVAVERRLADALTQDATAAYFYFCQLQSRYLELAQASGVAAGMLESVGDLPGLAQVLVFHGWMLIRTGRFEQATQALERSQDLFEKLQLTPVYGMGSHPLSGLVILNVVQGDYARAVALGERLKDLSTALRDDHNLAFACYGLTSAYLNQGQNARALQNGEQAVQVADEIGNHWFGAYCRLELGNVHLAMGHYEEAERYFRKSLQMKKEYRDPEGVAVTAKHLGEVYLLQHNEMAARQLFEQSLSIYRELNDQGGLAAAQHGLGQTAAQAGNSALAASHYSTALEIAIQIRFIPLQLSLLIDIGYLMLTNGRKQRGMELLRLAQLHPAASQQQREKAAALLKDFPEGIDAASLDLSATLVALQTEMQNFAPASSPPQDSPLIEPLQESLIEPLTDRELEVLQLLKQGLSNPAIAEKLFISTGTVKAHTNRIYSKLGVSNRVKAVLKAQELEILPVNPSL